MADAQNEAVRLALIELRLTAIEEREKGYITKEQFFPVKLLVFGATGLILSGVFTALVTLVVKGSP
ncbi:hypothetical protein [Pseudomonas oryzihabitans]|jgi:hypothetical protein|uniref:hypothetical protein n=1 Tax=Pseudomonas oryzihabitans TaxID=47885 RepID=UPI0028A996E8|nr:hypothetical protein [Pseudomonas oryzihabitans]